MEVITIALFFALLLKDIHAEWDEEVTLDIRIERNYVLSCPTSSETEFVLWYKQNKNSLKDVELAFSERYFFPALNEVQLRSLEPSDAGIYKCKSPVKMDVIKTFKINIIDSYKTIPKKKKIMKPPQWTLLPSPYTVVDNSRYVVIPCRAIGDKVKTKAFRLFDNGTKKQLPDSGVVLHRPKGSDSGKYMCQAENKAGMKVHNFELVVQVNGKFTQWSRWSDCDVECGYGLKSRKRSCTNPKPENGGKNCYGMKTQRTKCRERSCLSPKLVKFGFDMVGPNLILTCVGKGIPVPTVLWKFEGRKLERQYKPRTHRTVIPKRRARSGSYSCTIRNSSGYFTMYISIEK